MRWGEVDLARGIIRRVPNKTARKNPKPVIIPIHAVLRGMLQEKAPEERVDYVLPGTAHDYLNCRRELVRRIQKHYGECGIQVHKPGTGTGEARAVVEVGFHSLRHTFVSLCRESNAPLAVVEAIVGHSNPAMTRHYTHVGEVAAGLAVAALPAVIGESAPAPASNRKSPAALLRQMQSILDAMESGNWESKRAEGLALLAKA